MEIIEMKPTRQFKFIEVGEVFRRDIYDKENLYIKTKEIKKLEFLPDFEGTIPACNCINLRTGNGCYVPDKNIVLCFPSEYELVIE